MFQALFGNKDHSSNKGSKKSNVAGTGTSKNYDDASKLIHRSTNNPSKSSLSSSLNASVLEMVKEHNNMLARFLAGEINADIYREQLKRILQSSQHDNDNYDVKKKDQQYGDFLTTIARYNAALLCYATDLYMEGRDLLSPLKSSLVSSHSSKSGDDEVYKFDSLSYFRANALFLLLECNISLILAESSSTAKDLHQEELLEEIDEIVKYLEDFVECIRVDDSNEEATTSSDTSASLTSIVSSAMGEMKFRLHLYKVKISSLPCNCDSDTTIQKQSKKEIKSALEMYQQWRHQPRSNDNNFFYDDSASGNGLRMNQCALLLKANLELLKFNTRKALKLCVEAHAVAGRIRESGDAYNVKDNSSPDKREGMLDEILYLNNLGCLHFKSGKFSAALLYYNKALSTVTECVKTDSDYKALQGAYSNEGFLCQNIPLPEILHNSGVCALQLGQFEAAHDCFSRCMSLSPTLFSRRASCWLHMAESCVGMYTKCSMSAPKLNNSRVVRAPLDRALFCLTNCLLLINSKQNFDTEDIEEACRVMLAYVYLELNDPLSTLEQARILLSRSPNRLSSNSRRIQTLKLYACEASCILGNTNEALKWLSHEVSSENESKQQVIDDQLAEFATTFNQSSSINESNVLDGEISGASAFIAACATYMMANDFHRAELHARAAFNMNPQSRKAKNCLLYCLLKKGDSSEALNMLRVAST